MVLLRRDLMSVLVVVRHGQASFLEANYDRLSTIGERQARLLGDHWAATGVRFDEVFVGPCERHRETARAVGDAFRAAGADWPDPQELAGLDEYKAEEVLAAVLPTLLESHETVRRHYEAFQAARDREEKLRTFQRGYELIIDMWAHGRVAAPAIETWAEFRDRVDAALARIVGGSGANRRVAAFTSGGPVGVSMRRALGLDDRATLQVAWMIRNAAYCEFLFSGERFTLSQYNAFPHLAERELLTYR